MPIDLDHPSILRLKKAIKENPGNFVAIVGAGLSSPAGIPNWNELKALIIDDANKRISEIPISEQISHKNKLDRLLVEKDYWRLFENIKSTIGAGAYESCIKDALKIKSGNSVPESYDLLWKLNIAGMMTFNIDSCANDSYAKVFSKAPDHATGHQTTKYSYFLSSGNKFIFQPHGILSDSDSWVFTTSELERLLAINDYADFVVSLFKTRSVIFLGLNTEDFSLKYLFTKILNSQQRLGAQHYAVLANPSPELTIEYGNRNILVIPYRPTDKDHSEVNVLLKDIIKYSLPEVNYGSVNTETGADDYPYTVEELSKLPQDKLRNILNLKVNALIKPDKTPTKEDLDELEKFYKEYVLPIHTAWLVQPDTTFDNVLDYKVLKRVGKGAFGQVYEAEHSETKERVAIKLLLPELKDHREYLNSFRRGVRSMNILTSKNIDGMVKIKRAIEIPACIFMEFIDGLTLRDAVNNNALEDLSDCLKVLLNTGEIVRKGHNLEELVLHRDLKPDNIILRDFFGRGFDIDVVVLDFDLSWHKGALDLSIVDGARAQGYAAPEQTASFPKGNISSRHTGVDVFGLGMVAYFLFVGADPRPNEQNFNNYKLNIKNRIEERFNPDFIALSEYLSELIVKCTLDNQEDRISFDSAVESFAYAYNICSTSSIPVPHPVLLLELAAKVDKEGEYEVNNFGREVTAKYRDPSKTLKLSFSDNMNKKIMTVSFGKVRNQYDSRFVSKYLEKAKDKAQAKLKEGGFVNTSTQIITGGINITSDYILRDSLNINQIDKLASTIIDVRSCLDLN